MQWRRWQTVFSSGSVLFMEKSTVSEILWYGLILSFPQQQLLVMRYSVSGEVFFYFQLILPADFITHFTLIYLNVVISVFSCCSVYFLVNAGQLLAHDIIRLRRICIQCFFVLLLHWTPTVCALSPQALLSPVGLWGSRHAAGLGRKRWTQSTAISVGGRKEARVCRVCACVPLLHKHVCALVCSCQHMKWPQISLYMRGHIIENLIDCSVCVRGYITLAGNVAPSCVLAGKTWPVVEDRGWEEGGSQGKRVLKPGPRFRHFSTASAALLWGLLSETQEGGAGGKKRQRGRNSEWECMSNWMSSWVRWVSEWLRKTQRSGKCCSVWRERWYWLQHPSPFPLHRTEQRENTQASELHQSSCCRHMCVYMHRCWS